MGESVHLSSEDKKISITKDILTPSPVEEKVAENTEREIYEEKPNKTASIGINLENIWT